MLPMKGNGMLIRQKHEPKGENIEKYPLGILKPHVWKQITLGSVIGGKRENLVIF